MGEKTIGGCSGRRRRTHSDAIMGDTILIADDYGPELKMLTKLFSEAGFIVHSAQTCAEAVKLADQRHPDCFLLDYHLDAGNTAAQICDSIRSNERIRNNPIIIVSGDAEQAERSYEVCKADIFVEKGRSYTALPALVKRQLKRAEWASGVLKKTDLALDAANQRIIRGVYPAIQLSSEQFRFFLLLFESSPRFVSESEICRIVFSRPVGDCSSAIRSLACRLRDRLGPQLARRVKNRRNNGWIYVQPRIHSAPRPKLQSVER